MLPIVVIELPQAGASVEEARVMVEACSEALRPGRCELQGDSSNQAASAVAVISLSSRAPRTALVDVGRRSARGDVWLSEELSFRAGDAPIEQFRSIGLTVAVLFRELSSPDASRKGSSTPRGTRRASTGERPPKRPAPESPTARQVDDELAPSGGGAGLKGVEREPRLWIGGGPVVRAGGDRVRLGGMGSLGFEPLRPLVVDLSGHYEELGVAGVDLSIASIGAGAGVKLSLGRGMWVRCRAEAIAVRHSAEASDARTGALARQSLWVTGLRGVVDLVWSPTGFWGIAVSAVPETLVRGTTVTLYDRTVLTVPAVTWGASVGMELYPWAWADTINE